MRKWLEHVPEYLIEAWGLGTFMLSAGFFGALLEYPGSPAHQALPDPLLRRFWMGLAMGATAVALIYSPWGRRSGAHMNPATTLAFAYLGKVQPRDATYYALAQFMGGIAGVAVVALVLRSAFLDPPVRGVATLPGPGGASAAFLAETAMAFVLLSVVLWVSNSARLHRYTGVFVGCLLATYITVEAPISGMSLNPARTIASAVWVSAWDSLWVYFLAPPLGMLLAALAYVWTRGRQRVHCAKLNHHTSRRCIFNCSFGGMQSGAA